MPRAARTTRSGQGAIALALLAFLAVIALQQARVLGSLEFPAPDAVQGKLQTLSTVFLGIFLEALPFLLVGVLISALVHVYVSDAVLARLIPRRRVPAAVVGGLLGLVLPICECGAVPLSRRLSSSA